MLERLETCKNYNGNSDPHSRSLQFLAVCLVDTSRNIRKTETISRTSAEPSKGSSTDITAPHFNYGHCGPRQCVLSQIRAWYADIMWKLRSPTSYVCEGRHFMWILSNIIYRSIEEWVTVSDLLLPTLLTDHTHIKYQYQTVRELSPTTYIIKYVGYANAPAYYQSNLYLIEWENINDNERFSANSFHDLCDVSLG